MKCDWIKIRKDFPITKKYSYLDNALFHQYLFQYIEKHVNFIKI